MAESSNFGDINIIQNGGAMGILSKLFGVETAGEQKRKKFNEFENRHSSFPEMISLNKALWLTSRGGAYEMQGKHEDAIRDFKEAIAVKPDYSLAYVAWAIVLREAGRLDEALEVLLKAPRGSGRGGEGQEHISEFEILTQLAAVYLLKDDKEAFLKTAREAIQAASDPRRKEEVANAVAAGVVSDKDQSDDMVVRQLQEWITEVEMNSGDT